MRRRGSSLLLSAVVALGVTAGALVVDPAAARPAGSAPAAVRPAAASPVAADRLGSEVERPPGRPRLPRTVRPFVPNVEDRDDVRTAWGQWQALGLDEYVTVVRAGCFCPASWWTRPFVTRVVDGMVVSVTRPGRSRQLASPGYPMERMFRIVRSQSRVAEAVEVTFTEDGVPERIVVDQLLGAVDDEQTYRVRLRTS